MEISSVQSLCESLIYYSIQRCRILDDLCRLSFVLRQIPDSNPPLIRVSVSDTGAGSSLEEIQELRCSWSPFLASKWDGVISVATTNISDAQLHYANVKLNEANQSRRLTRLPSSSKNGAKFSGTEVSFLTSESLDGLLTMITSFLQKMFVLKCPKVAIETLVNRGSPSGSDQDSCILAIECNSLPFSSTYVECLRLGLANFILQHGNIMDSVCNSCYPSRDQLKVGVGQSIYSGRLRNSVNILDAVIIISEAREQASSSCCMRINDQTEIFYFENFVPSSISKSYVEAFTSIKWKKYGLTLKRTSNQDGHAFLEWDDLPPKVHISIALHCYCQQVAEPPSPRNCKVPRSVSKKAITSALNELKERNEGVLLSTHAVKICNYAPDLAKTISRLVLLSNDSQFKEECYSLLGLHVQEMEENVVESCIREKIVCAVGMNDRISRRNKEAASILFDDHCSQNVDYLDVDYEDEESNCVDF